MADQTRAALASKFGATQMAQAQGGNGAGQQQEAEPEAPPVAPQVVIPPAVSDGTQPQEQQPRVFGQRQKAPAAVPGAQQRLNRILPDGHRVAISKRLQDSGVVAHIGEFSPQDFASAGHNVFTFITRHLKNHLEPGVPNYFQVYSYDPSGKETYHGEHAVMGVPMGQSFAPPPPVAAPFIPPPALDPFDGMSKLQQVQQAQYNAWQTQQADAEAKMQEALKKAQQDGGGLAAALPAIIQAMRPQTPPTDPMREAELLEARIQRNLAPLAADVSNSLRAITERIERSAAEPKQPPADPMAAFEKIAMILKPQQPQGPSAAEIANMIRDAVERAVPKKDDGIGIRDYLTMKDSAEAKLQAAIDRERQEAKEERRALEKRLDDMRSEMRALQTTPASNPFQQLKDGIAAAKEVSGLINQDSGPTGILDGIANIAGSLDWDGLGGMIERLRGQPAVDETPEEPEEPPIEVREQPQPRPQQPQQPPQARPAPQPRPQQAAKPAAPAKPRGPAIKPSDLALNDYPDGLDVAPLVEAGSKEATTPGEETAAITAVLSSMWACRQGSPVWSKRIEAGLGRVFSVGEKAVPMWIVPFIRGLAKNGRVTLAVAEHLEASVLKHPTEITNYVRQKVREAQAAKKPAAAPAPQA